MQNILLVGAGTMGSVHAQAYAEMDNVNLVGIVDQDITRCQEMAEMYGTKAYDSFEKAMKELSDLLDVVDICVPTHLHKQYVLAVADYGKHVICEKPIARNAQEAREMIDYCKEKQVKLFVGDRKSTRLNSSHVAISYAVFCLKKKKKEHERHIMKPSSALQLRRIAHLQFLY